MTVGSAHRHQLDVLPADRAVGRGHSSDATQGRWAGVDLVSRRPDKAWMLFGDRVAPSDLQPAGNEVVIRHEASLYKLVVECGHRVGVRVSRPRLP